MRYLTLRAILFALLLAPATLPAQIRRGMPVDSNVVVKIWNPSGSLRLVGWDRDSLHVEGTGPKWAPFFFGGDRGSVKFGIEEAKGGEYARTAMVVYLPRGSRVSAKTVDASLDAENVSGFYTTVSGNVRVSGTLRELQVESLRGGIEVEARAPWVRIMGGEGNATVRGAIEDLAASTVAGRLSVDVSAAARTRLETMTGDLSARVAVLPQGSLELDSHAGTVELVLAPGARVDVDAVSVAGEIRNAFDARRPLPGRSGKGSALAFATDPAGARVVIRTYKGTIVLRKGGA